MFGAVDVSLLLLARNMSYVEWLVMVYLEEEELIVRDYLGAGPIYVTAMMRV